MAHTLTLATRRAGCKLSSSSGCREVTRHVVQAASTPQPSIVGSYISWPAWWPPAAPHGAEASSAQSMSSQLTSSARGLSMPTALQPTPAPAPSQARPANWKQLDIVFVSAEVAPWSKTGGLADVAGSLPKALAARGHRVMVVTPRYLSPETEARYAGANFTQVVKGIDLGPKGGFHNVGFYHLHKDQVDWVFVDHISYHRPGSPYGNGDSVYPDNLFRFSLLCMAAIEATLVLNIAHHRFPGTQPGPYGQQCLFVANDWHTALLPVFVAARFRPYGVHKTSKCVLALHNLAHQGSYPPAAYDGLGLNGDWWSTLEWVEYVPTVPGQPKAPTLPRQSINCLKAGIVAADSIVTVSQNYAAEICDPKGKEGAGLGSLLNHRASNNVLRGIVNGVDMEEWNPATDKHLAKQYTRDTLHLKVQCKMALQRELGLPVDPARPLLGFIGRLDYQKGPDLLLDSLVHLINLDCQVVILGSGAADYMERVKHAQVDHPYFVRGVTKFDVPLSHRIVAGCDVLLMPSRFEPCGLNQLYAQIYGTIPVAHSTGGLRDTIDDFNTFARPGSPDRGTGWTFHPASREAFVEAVKACIEVYQHDPHEWTRMQVRCMEQDFSWGRAARQYEKVFLDAVDGVAKKLQGARQRYRSY